MINHSQLCRPQLIKDINMYKNVCTDVQRNTYLMITPHDHHTNQDSNSFRSMLPLMYTLYTRVKSNLVPILQHWLLKKSCLTPNRQSDALCMVGCDIASQGSLFKLI